MGNPNESSESSSISHSLSEHGQHGSPLSIEGTSTEVDDPPIPHSASRSPTKENGDVDSVDGNNISPRPLGTPDNLGIENPHLVDAVVVATHLHVNIDNGLAALDADGRLARCGLNQLEEPERVSILKIFWAQIANTLTLVLVGALAISYGVQDWVEGGVITAVIVLNVVVGFWQQYKAEKTMDSLKSLSSPTASVIRDGEIKTVESTSIVPGDIVVFRSGDMIPADIRLTTAQNLEVNESLLTGESLPVLKSISALPPAGTEEYSVGDQVNVVWSSTVVTKGRGRGIVFGTGMNTQIGRIATALSSPDSPKNKSKKSTFYSRFIAKAMDFLGLSKGTPLQKKLNRFSYVLLLLALLSMIIVFAASKFRIDDDVLLYAIALGIGVIPESLIAVLTVTMALGAQRMAQRNVVVRRLDALESLGGITDICSDKTGTLTQGLMVVKKIWLPTAHSTTSSSTYTVDSPHSGALCPTGHVSIVGDEKGISTSSIPPSLHRFTLASSLCNNAGVKQAADGSWKGQGDPTEVALQVYSQKLDMGRESLVATAQGGSRRDFKTALSKDKESMDSPASSLDSLPTAASISATRGSYVFHSEYAFDSDIKRMTSLFLAPKAEGDGGDIMVFQKGAIERVLPCCTTTSSDLPLDDVTEQAIYAEAEILAAQGLRVLAFADRQVNRSAMEDMKSDGSGMWKREDVESDMTFLGLAGIYDPPRAETKDAIKAFRDAGIVVHMLTGDHIGTARAIALEIGLITPSAPASAVVTASFFDNLTETQVDALPDLPLVIARCSPQTKVRMIAAGKRRGRFLAMTGDGVNDAPSLHAAPVGIGMGKAGTDVAKDASDLILTDDNFDSIRWAICEGRIIFDNIQRFLIALLVANVGEVILLLFGLAFKDGDGKSVFPLSPLQILWVNMVTASLPAVGLGVEAAEANVMTRPPASLKSSVFSRSVITDTLFYGFMMGVTCLMSFVAVVYGPGHGNLGTDCNKTLGGCEEIFRARSVVFGVLTMENLLIAWELKSMSRSLFSLNPGRPFWKDLWANQLLFWSVIFGVFTIPLALYVPRFNTVVFRHAPISWEWSIIVGMSVAYVGAIEIWKFFVRRRQWGAKWLSAPVGGVLADQDLIQPRPRSPSSIRMDSTTDKV